MASTSVENEARRRVRRAQRRLAEEFRELRLSCHMSQRRLARETGVAQSTISEFEAGRGELTHEALERLAVVLGADLSLKVYPGTGPRIRDRWQTPMIDAFLSLPHPRWHGFTEVPVHHPVRGVIDAVIHDPGEGRFVAIEAESELRRVEQEIRWAHDKSDALPSSTIWQFADDESKQAPAIGRILLLRSTTATRQVAAAYPHLLTTAYPASQREILAAVAGAAEWPGDGIVWMSVDGTGARVIETRRRSAD